MNPQEHPDSGIDHHEDANTRGDLIGDVLIETDELVPADASEPPL